MSEQPLLDIVIVSWNTRDYLADCLESLARVAEVDGIRLGRVAIVDNASTDGGIDMVTVADLPLEIVRNARNEGFAVAVNQGSRVGTAPFILLLNPDVILLPGSLATPLALMLDDAAKATGVCGIKTLAEDGTVHRSSDRYPTVGRLWQIMTGLSVVAPRAFPGMRLNHWDHLDSRSVDHVIGAFYLVRRSLFEELGGLDERFFVYYEDIDFSRRVTNAGWQVHYLATASVFHAGGGSSNQVKAFRLALNVMSRCQYSLKHFNPAQRVLVVVGAAVVEPWARLGAALLARSSTQFREILSAYTILAKWVWKKIIGDPESRRPPR